MDTVNVVYTGASLGRISCCRSSANLPSSAIVPSSTSVGDSAVALALPWTSNPPTQSLGTSSLVTLLMEGTCCASQPAAVMSSAIKADTQPVPRLVLRMAPRAPFSAIWLEKNIRDEQVRRTERRSKKRESWEILCRFVTPHVIHLSLEDVLESLRVHTGAVPTPRVAPPVGARPDVLLALLVNLENLPDANHAVLALEHLVVLLERLNVRSLAVRVQPVQQRLPHVIGWASHLIHVKIRRVDVLVDAARDPSHVRSLCQVVAVKARESGGPNQDVIREVPDDVVTLELG